MKHFALSITALAVVAALATLSSGVASAAQLPLRLVAVNAGTNTKNTSADSNSADVVANEVNGSYFVPLSQLSSLERIRWTLVPSADGTVNISDLGTYVFDELSSELRVVVRPELFQTQVLGQGSFATAIPTETPAAGVLVGYEAVAQSLDGKIQSGLSWSAHTYLGMNRLELGGVAGNSVESRITRARLVRENLIDSSLVEVGTLLSRSGARGSPTSIVGFGLRRDSGITPGFITSPRLRVDGVVSSKSTVDVLIDNQKVSSSQLSAGPFSVSALPSITGGVASVIIKDELGVERVVSSQLFQNPSLLEIGKSEYGLWAGALNTYALQSKGVTTSGFYRRGLTNWLTVEASFEKASATNNDNKVARASAAVDVATGLGNFSVDYRGIGSAKQVSLTYAGTRSVQDWTFSLSGQATRSDSGYFYAGGGAAPAFSRTGSLSVSKSDLSGNFSLVQSANGRLAAVGVSYRMQSLGANLSVSVSRFSAGSLNSNSVFVGLSIPFGGASGSVSLRGTTEGVSKIATVSGQITESVNAGLSLEGVNTLHGVQGNVYARTDYSDVLVTAAKTENQRFSARTSVRGGLVVHPGGVTLMRPQYGETGYAVFNLGEPGVEVSNGYGGKAVTNGSGYAVLPMPALQLVKLDFDANTAPDGLDLTPISASAHRYGGVEFKRRAVVGRFLQVPAKTGILTVNAVNYPITDRGAWVELPTGSYFSTLDNGMSFDFEIK